MTARSSPRVDALVCDVTGDHYVWGEQDYILCSHLITPEKQRLSVRSVQSMIFKGERWKERLVSELGYKIVHSSADELLAMARHMTSVTADVTRWREKPVAKPDPERKPNRFELPSNSVRHRSKVVSFPDLAPDYPELEVSNAESHATASSLWKFLVESPNDQSIRGRFETSLRQQDLQFALPIGCRDNHPAWVGSCESCSLTAYLDRPLPCWGCPTELSSVSTSSQHQRETNPNDCSRPTFWA